jgi:hypothetical protein
MENYLKKEQNLGLKRLQVKALTIFRSNSQEHVEGIDD